MLGQGHQALAFVGSLPAGLNQEVGDEVKEQDVENWEHLVSFDAIIEPGLPGDVVGDDKTCE